MISRFLIALSLTMLPAAAMTQTKGTYDLFGSGCGASGRQCNGHDPKGKTLRATLPNEYALPFKVTATTVVTGARFQTKSTGGVHTVRARLFKSLATGAPDANPLAETLMTVGPNQQMWAASFNKAVPLTAGDWFVSFEPYVPNSATAVLHPCQMTDGTVTRAGAYWRRPSSPNWSRTGIVDKPWFEVICSGTAPVLLSNTGVPEIGKSYSFDLSQGQTGSIAIGVLGSSNVKWGAIPLPLALNPVAPGCWLFASLDIAFPRPVSATGTASVTLGIPAIKGLVGVKIYNQYLMTLNGANAINVLFSNGGEGQIGG